MPLISHRGAAGLEVANTLEAISFGNIYDSDYIEIDINATADDVLIIHHGKLARFLRGKKLKETYHEILLALPRILTLEEFVSKCPKRPYIFDIKICEDASLRQIEKVLAVFKDSVIAFTSPHTYALQFMQASFPHAMIMQNQPYHHGPITALEIARRHKFDGIALNKWWMTPLVYRLCKIHHKKLMCYTVDSRIGIQVVAKLFPDVYIVTNRPDIYRQLYPIHK